MTKTSRVITILATALVLLAAVGCRGTGPVQRPVPLAPPPAAEPAPAATVNVYLIRDERVGVGGRTVEASDDTQALLLAAMSELVEGPTPEETEFGLTTTIPEGTRVNGVEVADGFATVDLSREFESGGGSLSMLLRVAQVVCTATQFEGIDAVAFQLDGEPVEAIGGEGVIVDPPLTRTDVEEQLPAILVESPYPGQEVTSPLEVRGSSNVFEATHQLQLTDADGLIIHDEFVTATSGTGTRGTWSQTVEFGPLKRDGLGAVIVFEYSAEDGSRINIVEIPVRVTR